MIIKQYYLNKYYLISKFQSRNLIFSFLLLFLLLYWKFIILISNDQIKQYLQQENYFNFLSLLDFIQSIYFCYFLLSINSLIFFLMIFDVLLFSLKIEPYLFISFTLSLLMNIYEYTIFIPSLCSSLYNFKTIVGITNSFLSTILGIFFAFSLYLKKKYFF